MDDIDRLKLLAGIKPANSANLQPYDPGGSNITVTAMEKSNHQRENNIQPGTDEWFRLWFARPYLTGERPF